jgi:GT2 family glycosyltransferase
MKHFWQSLIEPMFTSLKPKSVVEIGSSNGRNTRNLIEFSKRTGAVVHAIDPHPRFDAEGWAREPGAAFVFHQGKSLDVLESVGPADAVLIDGDHNWYTVYHELELIARIAHAHAREFPLVLLHDIHWPYGRRDLYYNPDDIPPEYRHPFRREGLLPGNGPLVLGGMNDQLFNAVAEYGPKNGVLTAVEDFLDRRTEAMQFTQVHGFHGLGILVPESTKASNPRFAKLIHWIEVTYRVLGLHLQELEDDRIRHLIKALGAGARPSRSGAIEPHLERKVQPGASGLEQTERTRRPGKQENCQPRDMETGQNSTAAAPAAIVIPVHNALADLRQCLTSLFHHTPSQHRLILVDDGSDEPCRDFLRDLVARRSTVALVRNESAVGFTKAANQGITESREPLIVLLNSDTHLTPGWIERLIEVAESSPEIGMVGPLSNAGAHQSVPNLPYGERGKQGNPLPPGWTPERVAAEIDRLSVRAFPRVPMLDGFCVLIKQDLVDAIGLLDEESFPQGYGEMFDYSLRAEAAGFECVVADHAYVYHVGSRSIGSARRKSLRTDGSQRLRQLYGQMRFKECRRFFQTQPVLVEMRHQLGELLRDGRESVEA